MKVQILADSQSEFDEKCDLVVKALSGVPTEERKPHFRAQKDVNEMWDAKFKQMLEDLKREINEIIE